MTILLAGGKVATANGAIRTDLLIDGPVVAAIGDGLRGEIEYDCRGAWVGPGLVDLHVHLREPGQTDKEEVVTGCAAAAAGGFTGLVAMANTIPPIDTPNLVQAVESRATLPVELKQAAAITAQRSGADLSTLSPLLEAGVRIFSDDGDWVADSAVLKEAMALVARVDGLIVQHTEDRELTGRGIIHAGPVANQLGLAGIPSESESSALARDLRLVAETGCRYHAQHLSAAASVELIKAAKAAGLPVTAEVTPHHLFFDESELKSGDPNFKMKPPLRTEQDRQALVAALRSGVIDAVATDHAPHQDAGASLAEANFGVVGLETAAAAVNSACSLEAELFFERMSVAPARIAGMEEQGIWPAVGTPANLMVFDPVARWTPARFRSKSSNSPFLGRPLRGRVRLTIHKGVITHADAGT